MSDAILILAMMLVTFIPRYLPMAIANRLNLPAALMQALEYVPVAVLTVIVIQSALFRDGILSLSIDNHYLPASIVAFLSALIFRKLLITITAGLVVFALTKILLG